MMIETDEKELTDWIKESEKVEQWNDLTRLRLFQRAKNLIPILKHEIEVLREQIKLKG